MTEVVQKISKQHISEPSQYATKCNFMIVLVLKTQLVPPKKIKTNKTLPIPNKNSANVNAIYFHFCSSTYLAFNNMTLAEEVQLINMEFHLKQYVYLR